MMPGVLASESQLVLLASTAAVAVVHTALGPDHYLPFAAMARAFSWSRRRLAALTLLCGIGHILSSVALGLIGIAAGASLGRLESIEGIRGELAAYALVAFGLIYGVWGLRNAALNRAHEHVHAHADGTVHAHAHTHADGHLHPHGTEKARKITPWMLFSIFLLGPCEPMIPLLMLPAATVGWVEVGLVAGVFSIATLLTMVVLVLAAHAGLRRLRWPSLERYVHAVAGAAILACGLAILALGV